MFSCGPWINRLKQNVQESRTIVIDCRVPNPSWGGMCGTYVRTALCICIPLITAISSLKACVLVQGLRFWLKFAFFVMRRRASRGWVVQRYSRHKELKGSTSAIASVEGRLLRCMSVIWCICHVLQLLSIRFIQQNSCCNRKSPMKHKQKPDSKSHLPWFSYGYWKYMFADFLTWLSPPKARSLAWNSL